MLGISDKFIRELRRGQNGIDEHLHWEVFLEFANRGLRSLSPTMEIPEHVFVASDSLDAEHQTEIWTALMELNSTEIGVRILQSIKPSITGVIAGEDADYDQLRGLLKFLDEDSE